MMRRALIACGVVAVVSVRGQNLCTDEGCNPDYTESQPAGNMCLYGYYWDHVSTCKPCSLEHCGGCVLYQRSEEPSPDGCYECEAGYGFDETPGSYACIKCSAIIDGCLLCSRDELTSKGVCDECDESHTMNGDRTCTPKSPEVKKCEAGKNGCIACDADTDKCTQCDKLLALQSDGTCRLKDAASLSGATAAALIASAAAALLAVVA
ncbi:hypothetical protein, conserved [Angomonas deanei]|uniref:Uncharacterized protein n=1 Tax=Angomonas deanei TaxID=59799 RepID=A0A7G2C8H8_9TRYP|nr:hypothetical protein, conserved [Angomonas deanei]CAD2215745.1 hypothetical protein, conserved [Angomonas deanei]CAD2215750.1 hypothetical protein, conserved [Angomonas deanei]